MPPSRIRPAGAAARAWTLGLVLCAAAPAGFAQSAAKSRPPVPPLSAEDAALVKEMALLERVELLRNLELFEPGDEERDLGPDDPAPPKPAKPGP